MVNIVQPPTNLYPKFYNYAQADTLGLHSKTEWGRRGRTLKPDAQHSGLISRTEGKSQGHDNIHPIIRDLEPGFYLISTSYFEVYSIEETEPKKTKNKEEHSTLSSPSSLPSISFVSRGDTKSASNSLFPQGVTSKIITKNQTTGRPRVNNGYFAYCPALETDHENALGEDIERAKCVIHSLYQFRFFSDNKKRADDWIELGSVYCKNLFGWDEWTHIRDRLLSLGVMEQTKAESFEELGIEVPRGRKGRLAYAYRLREDYRRAKHTRHALRHPKTINMLERHKGRKLLPIHRWLEKNLSRITIEAAPEELLTRLAREDTEDTGTVEAKLDSYRESMRWIAEGSFFVRIDGFSSRFHSNLTQLKSELRKYLRVNGERLCQIDIKCCQPLLIGLLAKKAGFTDDRYLQICEQDLYQFIAEKMGLSRKEVKEKLTQRGLFSSNRSKHQGTNVMRFFKKEFPQIHKYMTLEKSRPRSSDNPKPHNRLAMLAQSEEVDLVIHTVCERIRKERPEMFLATIHDSVVMLQGDSDFVKMLMLNEFSQLGLNPNLQVERYE